MLGINISPHSDSPLYKQIVEQIKQRVANSQLKAGDHIPTVRELAIHLQINPATVARAYQELEQQGIVGASRRRGTIVLGDTDSPQRIPLRQNQLASMVNKLILEGLSIGYSPDELEASFTLNLARWRIQRVAPERSQSILPVSPAKAIHIVGSNDVALDLLVNRLKYQDPEVSVQITAAGSLGGLLAIQAGKADMAGIHLLDEESGQYNYPYIKHILPGIPVAVVHLADRIQGFMVSKGNPKRIQALEDLKRSDITIVNRQKGSGTRVWLDHKLRELGITPDTIKGYGRELDTHLAVALSILKGDADTGLGIQAAAKSCNLDFIPITKEKFDLVIPQDKYQRPLFASLVGIIRSDEFKKVVIEMGGYDTTQTGEVVFIE
jgi:molybdate-binding protein/DNA-binding transcriptional regulator YhcF (GntR family)